MMKTCKTSVLLTVPHLNPTASPYNEMMSIARYLPNDEFRLTICSLRDGGFSETAPVLKDLGIPCFVAPFRPTGHSPKHFLASYREQKTIDRYGPFNIQHSLDFTSSPFEAIMARLRLRRFIYNQRNLNENGHKRLLKIKAACAHRIISISETVSQFLVSLGITPAVIRKIYNGLDLQAAEQTSCARTFSYPYILCVGQFEPRKRHQDAIRAFAAISADCPKLQLLLAGNTFDQAYFDELPKLAEQLGVRERVQFLGPRRDVLGLMRNARALLLCSEHEAFGWVLVEAMSMGLPVISSAVDGPSELIEHEKTGLLVPVGDVPAYVSQLRRILQNPQFARTLATEARSAVEQKYSARNMVTQIQDVYREVLAL
jgi:glycosyltransferase involved in cell wall biosynthesis